MCNCMHMQLQLACVYHQLGCPKIALDHVHVLATRIQVTAGPCKLMNIAIRTYCIDARKGCSLHNIAVKSRCSGKLLKCVEQDIIKMCLLLPWLSTYQSPVHMYRIQPSLDEGTVMVIHIAFYLQDGYGHVTHAVHQRLLW